MPRIVALSAIAAVVALILVLVFGLQPAADSVAADSPEGPEGSVLTGDPSTFLPDHYDQRFGVFDPDSSGTFDDGADTLLFGEIDDLGDVTVESSAAWD